MKYRGKFNCKWPYSLIRRLGEDIGLKIWHIAIKRDDLKARGGWFDVELIPSLNEVGKTMILIW